MPSARLTERITFQQEGTVDDGIGGQEDGWVDVFTRVSAAVRPLFGKEEENADQVQSTSRYRVIIRRNSAIRANMRILWASNGDKVLNIVSLPDHGPRSLNMELLCEAGAAH